MDAIWIRLRSSLPLAKATAWFTFSGANGRATLPRPAKFTGLARPGSTGMTGGLVRARDGNKRTLQLAAANAQGKIGTYTLGADLALRPDGSDQDWN